MAVRRGFLLLLAAAVAASSLVTAASGAALAGDTCAATSPSSCGAGMRCATCSPLPGSGPALCSRTTPLDPKTHGMGLPFNKYSWLTTHNSFAVAGTTSATGSPIVSPPNQEDTVTSQLKNGVRGLMLDTYDFKNDVWLCHSFSGKCFDLTAYRPALSVLKEIQGFLESNPSEVITIFVEDYATPGSLAKVFAAAGLTKYMFPAAKMPKNGGDWPLLKDMITQGHRLLVFTSKQGKEASDGIAHEWSYVVETQYGSEGLVVGACPKRAESRPMDSTEQSLVLMNFFTTNPSQSWACMNNSAPLISKLKSCYDAAAKRWPNFIAVDFYMRSTGGGAPLATDVANGRLQCGCDSIAYCKANTSSGTCAMSSSWLSPSSSPSLALTPSSSRSSSPSLAPALAPSLSLSSWPSPSSSTSSFSSLSSSSSPTLALASSPSPSSFSPLSSSPSPTSASTPSLSPSLSSSPSTSSWWSSLSLTSAPSPSLSPSLSPSAWPSLTLALTPTLSPSLSPSLPPSSSPSLTPTMSPSPTSSSSTTTVSPKSIADTGMVEEAPPKSTAEEAPPKSTVNAGTTQEASPKSIREAPGMAPEAVSPDSTTDDDDSSSAAIRPGASRWSFLTGLVSLVVISLARVSGLDWNQLL